MDNNGDVELDDNGIAGREDEKVVTMMDVLKEQEDFEEDANAVLGASDDKNCTYSMGYIKRQAIYACMTCNPNAKDDPTQRAGVCLACSLKCHEDHELVELYTKRNFRCDCGNPKFKSHPCHFTPNKPDLNEGNSYNQNFSGLYCICERPYPDPDVTEEDEMIQCIICEDWLHSAHLDATVPDNDQYAEMICKQCMDKNSFLHNYGNLIVNSEADAVDISLNGIFNNDTNEKINTTNNMSINLMEPLDGNKDTLTEVVDDDNSKMEALKKNAVNKETDDENKLKHANIIKPDCTNVSQNQAKTNLNIKVMEAESEGNSNNDFSQEDSSITHQNQHEKEASLNNLQNVGHSQNAYSNIEPSELPLNKDVTEEGDENLIFSVNNVNTTISSTENNIYHSVQETLNENKAGECTEMDCDPDIRNSCEKSCNPQIGATEETETKLKKDLVEGSEELVSTKSGNEIEDDRLLKDPVDQLICGEIHDTKTKVPDTIGNITYIPKGKFIPDGAQSSSEKMSTIDKHIDELTGLGSANKSDSMSSEYGITNDHKITTMPSPKEGIEKSEYKRKLTAVEQDENLDSKKLKLDSKPCSKPLDVKRRYIGATFWQAHFRQKLCTCNDCLSMYKDLSVLFLIDSEDTVSAYENLGKAKTNGKPASEYEKGLAALSSLDRVQQINALTEYNKMRDKLLDFLKSFKDRKEVVKEEDIKAFFAGMKPKREPDGVYFCR